MSNVVSIGGEGPIEDLTDQYYFIFKFIDGEVRAWQGDYIGNVHKDSPIMIIFSGPEATQVPVAAINSEQMKYADYRLASQVVVRDGEIAFEETDYVEIEKKIQEEEGYV